MRFVRLLGLVVLAIPLLGGSCSFSSSNGDTTVVVQTGDCVGSPDDPSPCTPRPDPDGMAVTLETASSPSRVATEPWAAAPGPAPLGTSGAPAVPALGGLARLILATGCVATAATRLRRLRE